MKRSKKFYPIIGDDLGNTLFGDSPSFLPKKKGRDSTIDARGGDDTVYGDALSMLGGIGAAMTGCSRATGSTPCSAMRWTWPGGRAAATTECTPGRATIRSSGMLEPCRARPAAATTG
jgi:hypothetical protein